VAPSRTAGDPRAARGGAMDAMERPSRQKSGAKGSFLLAKMDVLRRVRAPVSRKGTGSPISLIGQP